MHITTKEFDKVVGGLSALVNVLSNRLKDRDEKLDIAKTLDEELRQENIRLRDELSEILLLNQNLREEVAKLQGMDVATQRAEFKKEAIKQLEFVVSNFRPEESNFARGFKNAIDHLQNLK